MVVVVAILSVLLAIVVPVVARARAASQRVGCVSNLRQIVQCFHLFADSNGGTLPDPQATHVSWEASLLPYAHPRLFACPADTELYPAVGSSYDWRDTNDPQTTLAGQRIHSPLRSSLILTFEALPGWHLKKHICAGRLDGAAAEMDYEQCMRDLDLPNTVVEVPR